MKKAFSCPVFIQQDISDPTGIPLRDMLEKCDKAKDCPNSQWNNHTFYNVLVTGCKHRGGKK